MFVTVDKSRLFAAGISRAHARATDTNIADRLGEKPFLDFAVAHDTLVRANAGKESGFPFVIIVGGGTAELRTFTAAMLSRLMIALGRSAMHVQASKFFDDKFSRDDGKDSTSYTDPTLLVLSEVQTDVPNKGRLGLFRELLSDRLSMSLVTVVTTTHPVAQDSEYVRVCHALAGVPRTLFVRLK